MKNSKLFALIQHLDTKDLQRLELYLQSPFFVEKKKKAIHAKAVKLFFLIKQNCSNIESVTKEFAFAYLYPNLSFKLNKINRVLCYLVGQIENFIIYTWEHQETYENNIRKKRNLLSFYATKKLDRLYEAQKRSIQKYQTQITACDSIYHLQEFLLACKYARIASVNNNRKSNLVLKKLITELQSFYNLSLLEIACVIKSGIVLNNEELQLINQSLLQIKHMDKTTSPIIDIYQYALKLMEEEAGDEIYKKYKNLLMEYYTYFSREDIKSLFIYALNYCVVQLNAGKEDYYVECWELYCLGLERGILYTDNKISPSTLKNIVTLSLRLKKYEWAEQFLHQHKNNIQTQWPKEVYSFNLANVLFYQKKYDEVYTILRTLKCKDVFYELALRRLEIKALYEQEKINVLYAKLNAYRVFIHRNTVINTSSREMNNNFLNIIYKLIKTIPTNKKKMQNLTESLTKIDKLAERQWLNAKLITIK